MAMVHGDMSFEDIQNPADLLLYRAAMAASQGTTTSTADESLHSDYGTPSSKGKESKSSKGRGCRELQLLFISNFFDVGSNDYLLPVFNAETFHPSILDGFNKTTYNFGDADAPFIGFFSLDYRPDVMAMEEIGCLLSEGGFLLDLSLEDAAPYPSASPYETQIFTKGYVCASAGFDGSGDLAAVTFRDAITGGFGVFNCPSGTVTFTPLPVKGPIADYCQNGGVWQVQPECFINTLRICEGCSDSGW